MNKINKIETDSWVQRTVVRKEGGWGLNDKGEGIKQTDSESQTTEW